MCVADAVGFGECGDHASVVTVVVPICDAFDAGLQIL
jgi:hypothetical protein